MRSRIGAVKAVSIVFPILFLLATFAGCISLGSTLLSIWDVSGGFQNPSDAFYFFTLIASVGVLLFGITLSFVNLGAADRRNFLWSACVLAIPLFCVDSVRLAPFVALPASVGALLICVILTFGNLGEHTAERRHFLGSELLAGGVLAILFAVLTYILNMEDEGPRCLFGCAPSLMNEYHEVYISMTILAIIGLVTAGFGIRLLMRKVPVISNLTTQSKAR